MNAGRHIVSALLIVIFATTPAASFLATPKHAEAQLGAAASCSGILSGASSAIGSLFSAGTVVPVADPALINKEECLDALAYALANIMIQAMSSSIINWINSGFEGGPTFVTDLEEFLYLVDVGALEEFLGSDAVALICSPWRFDIDLALRLNFFQPDVPACSLGEVVDNIDGFLAGDFSQGGWDGWYRLTTRNNPYRDFIEAESALNARIASARYTQTTPLDWGNGFLSGRDCSGIPGPQRGAYSENCPISTPGTVIETQLNNVLGVNTDRLVLADEINEIVDAFISQLIYQTLTRGLSELQN